MTRQVEEECTEDGSVIRGLMWCGALYAAATGLVVAAGVARHIWKLVAP